MTVLLAAALAGAASAVLLAVPAAGPLRLAEVTAATRTREPVGRALPFPRSLGAVAMAGALALVLAGPVPAGLALLGGLVVVRVRARQQQAAVAARERAGAVQACGVLAGELAAGRSPADALAAAADVACGPVQRGLSDAAVATRLGGDVPGVLVAAADGSAVAPVLRSLAACWAVCAQSGGGLSAAVRRLEEGLRAEAAQRRRVEAELAGPRATAGLLAVLPVGGLLLAAGVGADPLHVLLETPVGLVCLALGLGFDALGVLWTERLVRRVRPP